MNSASAVVVVAAAEGLCGTCCVGADPASEVRPYETAPYPKDPFLHMKLAGWLGAADAAAP